MIQWGCQGKRDTPFQKQHEAEYALEVTVRDMKGAVDSVQCLFCVYRGREARSESDTTLNLTDNLDVRMVESDTSFNALPPTHYVSDGLFWMNDDSVCEHIKDQVSWILTHRSSFQFEHLYLYHIRDHGLATY